MFIRNPHHDICSKIVCSKIDKKQKRNHSKGLTFVDILIATTILSVAIMGMTTTWMYMFQLARKADSRSAAYECAQMVLERAKLNGYSLNIPATTSVPIENNSRSAWISPHVLRTRFYDATLEELAGGSNQIPVPTPTAGTRFVATTQIFYSPEVTFPVGRDDLRLMTIQVTIKEARTDGVIIDDILAKIQTCMTKGGL